MGARIRANTLDTGLALVLDTHPDGVLIVDAEGVVRYANPSAGRLFGVPLHTIVDHRFRAPVRLESPIDMHDGGGGLLELRTVETVWGGHVAYMVCVRDVTRERKMENEIRRLRAEVEYATAPTPAPAPRVAWPGNRQRGTG